jgi:hypothetical protein
MIQCETLLRETEQELATVWGGRFRLTLLCTGRSHASTRKRSPPSLGAGLSQALTSRPRGPRRRAVQPRGARVRGPERAALAPGPLPAGCTETGLDPARTAWSFSG